MTRIFLTYILPLVLPSLIYVLWIWNARRTHDPDSEDDLPGLRRGPLFWSLVSGFLLMITGLITIALMSGDPPDDRFLYMISEVIDGNHGTEDHQHDQQ